MITQKKASRNRVWDGMGGFDLSNDQCYLFIRHFFLVVFLLVFSFSMSVMVTIL